MYQVDPWMHRQEIWRPRNYWARCKVWPDCSNTPNIWSGLGDFCLPSFRADNRRTTRATFFWKRHCHHSCATVGLLTTPPSTHLWESRSPYNASVNAAVRKWLFLQRLCECSCETVGLLATTLSMQLWDSSSPYNVSVNAAVRQWVSLQRLRQPAVTVGLLGWCRFPWAQQAGIAVGGEN